MGVTKLPFAELIAIRSRLGDQRAREVYVAVAAVDF
jgi:hypothetical protein